MKQSRGERHNHVYVPYSGDRFAKRRTASVEFSAGKDAEHFLPVLLGAFTELALGSRLPERTDPFGLNGLFEFLEKRANSNARELC